MRSVISCLFLALAFPSVAEAQLLNPLAFVEEVRSIDTSDGVSDNCWTNAGAVRARIEFILGNSGIAVTNNEAELLTARHPAIHVNLNGYRLNGGACIASFTFEVLYFTRDARSTDLFVKVQTFRRGFIINSRTNGNLNESSLRVATQSTEEFINRIRQERRTEEYDYYIESQN